MPKYYGIKEQKEAQQYIRQRLDSEYAMGSAVDELLSSFANLYLEMLQRGATQEELDSLVHFLAAQLLEDCETLAVDEHEDNRDAIILFITRDYNGESLADRIRKRCKTFANEVFLLFVVGKLLGKSKNEIRQSIVKNWDKPYDNPLILEAREKQEKGEISVPVSMDQPHYGQGVPVSSHKAILDNCLHALIEGWGWHDYLEHKDAAVGYVVQRGSSYPCDVCDSFVGYHDITDTESLPMYHSHCRCYVIWVYNKSAL